MKPGSCEWLTYAILALYEKESAAKRQRSEEEQAKREFEQEV